MLLLITDYYCEMPDFSTSEMRKMIYIYAQTDFCGRASPRWYSELYPNIEQPWHKLFNCRYDRLLDKGQTTVEEENKI